jgi:thiosulfate/3-mercaptopyruvate sulfurtransferase
MALPGILVDSTWLELQRSADTAAPDGADIVVADVRWYLDGRSGPAAYEVGHLPGAVFVDLATDLATPGQATDGRHPLPTPAAFAQAMGRLGIGDDTAVIAYDDSSGGTAGRLVWMLRSLGRSAALLDGGMAAWTGPLETGPGAPRPPATFTAQPWPADWYTEIDEVARRAIDGTAAVLDARAADRYRGDHEPVDRAAGHIPGARNLPWADLIDPTTKRYRSADELRARFAAVGVDEGTSVIASCGSGVSACADLVGLEHAGLGRGRLFVASWSGWSSDGARPLATGDTPAGQVREGEPR